MLEPLADFQEAARARGREGFCAWLGSPVFLVEPFTPAAATGFGTVAGVRMTDDPERVGRVKKREGANAFGMITIGRAANNDVVIQYEGVSKFHAHVTCIGDTYKLVDAASTYGTSVRGTKLPSRGSHVLACGDELHFGDLTALFYTPEGFHDVILRRG